MNYQYSENQWGERFIDSLNRTAFSTETSCEYYEKRLNIDLNKKNTLFVVVGSDSGLIIRYLASRLTAVGSRVVIVEPSDIFNAVLQECSDILNPDGTLISDNESVALSLHSHADWQSQVFDGSDTAWFYGGDVEIIESQACRTDYTQVYLPIFKNIRVEVEKRQIELHTALSNTAFIETQVMNAADNTIPLLIDPDFGNGFTAVILGGGPSLDKHLDWVLKNRDKLFIISVSRLCSILDSVSLVPDLLISIDPQAFSFDSCKEGVLWKDVPLISSYHVAPQLMQQWQGPRFHLGPRLPWLSDKSEMVRKTISSAGPTVGHTAVVVASQLGFTTILMTGVDLCYDSSINTHSKASPEAAFQNLPSLYDAQVETYSGHMAGTHQLLLSSASSLENIGKVVNQYTDVLFNLNDRATKISTIPYLDINTIKLPQSKPDFSNHITEFSQFDFDLDLKNLSEEVTLAKRQYLTIKRSCKKAHSIIDRMYQPANTAKYAHFSAQLNKIDKKLDAKAGGFVKSIKLYATNRFSAMKKPSGFDDMQSNELEQWIREYYSVLSYGADKYLSMIFDLEKRIQLRRSELTKNLNIEDLIEAWNTDNTPGRVLGISKLDIAQFGADEQSLIENAKKVFIDSVHNTNTKFSRKLVSRNLDIDNCMRSLTFLFSIKNKTDLHSLSTNLQDSPWPGTVLLAFAQGLIAEIDSQHETAITHYQSVVDECSERLNTTDETLASMQRIIEDSLVRLTQNSLALNDYISACNTLGALCEILPQYIMSYAKLLNLCGNTSSSVELLQEYLNHYPGRWDAAQLLADILNQSGSSEEAQAAQRHSDEIRTSSRMPDSKAA